MQAFLILCGECLLSLNKPYAPWVCLYVEGRVRCYYKPLAKFSEKTDLKRYGYIISLLAVAFCVVSWTDITARSRNNGNEATATESLRKKARHYFLAATVADAEGREPEAYELLKKAYATDSTYDVAAYHFGLARMQNNQDTMRSDAEMTRSLRMIKRFVDNNPDDVQENLYYAYLAGYANPQDAERVFSRVVDKFPERTTALLQLAETQLRLNKYDDAIKNLSRYEDIEGANPQVSMRKLQIMVHKEDSTAALEEANRLVDKFPADTRYRLLRSTLAGALGDTLQMERDLLESDRLDPDNASVKLALADLALTRGDSIVYDNYVYEALLSPGLEFEDKKEMLGEYLQQLLDDNGDSARGDRLFEELDKQYPHQPELIDLEARYRMVTGNPDQAIELMEYALDLDPGNETYFHHLMGYAFSAKNYDKADSIYERAKNSFEPDNDMQMLHALALSLGGHSEKAIRAYGEILEPILGIADPAEPIEGLRPFPKIDLYQSDVLKAVYTAASDLYWKAGMDEATFTACSNALFLDPDDALNLNNYAYFLAERSKELPKARQMAMRAVELEPGNPTYMDTYAWVLFKIGEYADALEMQKKAIEAGEKESSNGMAGGEYYEHLAEILKATGDNAGAREAAAKAKKIDKND